MECPKCGKKAATRSEICFYCGHDMSKPYVPGEDDNVADPDLLSAVETRRAHKTHFVSDFKTKSDFPVSNIILGVLIAAVIGVVIYLVFALGGSNSMLGRPALDTQEDRALYELSQIQKAQNNAMRDIQSYMDFQQLADAGYLAEIEIESVDPTRLVTPNAVFELNTVRTESNYLIYADTRDGVESWTIDQDSKDALKTYGGG